MAEYIERERVLKVLAKYGFNNGGSLGRHSGAVDCAAAEIERLPSSPPVAPVRRTEIRDGECVKCGWFGDCVEALDYKFCPGCGAQVDGTQPQREDV